MLSLPALFLLVFILIIVVVLIKKNYTYTNTRDNIEEIEAWFDDELPVSNIPDSDYLNSTFVYRYQDSFIYHSPNSTQLYQVYPLCCEKCTRNAHTQLIKRRALDSKDNTILAPLVNVARYSIPPRNQGQATDDMTYVVLTLTRLLSYPTLHDLTRKDLAQFMKSLAIRSSWKINDVSVANVGRHPTNKLLLLQFSDDFSASPRPKNLFYNRYNILKHIPESSFIDPHEYSTYPDMLGLIKESKDHIRDLDSFILALG